MIGEEITSQVEGREKGYAEAAAGEGIEQAVRSRRTREQQRITPKLVARNPCAPDE